MTEDERRAIEADCERLIRRYVNLNDAQDWEAVANLYTEDARFARPTRAQRHVIANTVVEVESPTEARAFSVIVLYMGDAADDGGLPVMDAKSPLVGTFTDRLVCTPKGWRFKERVGGLDFRP